jgi:hypothetical protein
MVRWLVSLVIALGMAAPAWARAPRPDLANVHSIGVISAVGDRAEITYIGALVFMNRLTYLPISDWRLDDLAAAEAGKALSDRFAVKPISADPAIFANVHESLFKSEAKSLEGAMHLLPPSDVDAYLVILPTTEPLPYPSNQSISGAGVYRTWPGVGGADFQLHVGEAIVHLTYVVYLVDAKTGHVIAGHLGVAPGKEKRSLTAKLLLVGTLFSPHRYTHDASWPTTATALTTAQTATLRDALIDLIKSSVGYTVGQMSLGGGSTKPPGT